MARRSQQVRCERCGRMYRPCRYNRHRQKYCAHESCVAERARERKRVSYHRRYQDAVFRESEQERCRESLQGRREAAVVEAVLPPPPPPTVVKPLLPNLELMTAGLVAHLINSNDLAEVLASARRLERRGQLLAIGVSPGRGSPDG